MLLELFSKIEDKRRGQAKAYDLPHLFLFSLLAILANCNNYKQISVYIRTHILSLNSLFWSNRKKWPAHSTINYFFMGINIEALETVFREHSLSLLEDKNEMNHIAIDGKCLRWSYDHTAEISALQVISSYLVNSEIILSHEFIVGQKTNEIPMVQKMIQEIWLENVVVTADAMHCQKKHLRQ